MPSPPMRVGQTARAKRLWTILNTVERENRAGRGVDEARLVNTIMVAMGLRDVTAREHVELLLTVRKLARVDGALWVPDLAPGRTVSGSKTAAPPMQGTPADAMVLVAGPPAPSTR